MPGSPIDAQTTAWLQIFLRPAPDHRPAAITWHHQPPPLAPAPLPLAEESPAGPPVVERLDEQTRGRLEALCLAIVDTVAGRRAPQQLVRWVDDRALSEILLRARLQRRSSRPLGVRSQSFRRYERRVEATLRIGDGDRCAAVALRFDRQGNRWVCTVVDFGPEVGTAADQPLAM